MYIQHSSVTNPTTDQLPEVLAQPPHFPSKPKRVHHLPSSTSSGRRRHIRLPKPILHLSAAARTPIQIHGTCGRRGERQPDPPPPPGGESGSRSRSRSHVRRRQSRERRARQRDVLVR